MKKKIFKSLKKGIQDAKKGRTIAHSKLKKEIIRLKNWEKNHPILTKFKRLRWWLRYIIKNKLEDIPLNIKSFIQRGKRGWSNRDVWGLDYYLANTITKTIYNLKENTCGFPIGLTEGKWVDILNTIKDTFYYAKEISNGQLYLIRSERKRKHWQKHLDKINKKHNCYDRCMTDKEIKAYDAGWELFKKYFFSLWD